MSEPPPISLNAARELVIEALSNHFAQDDLSLDELERRLERAYKANTIAELDQLTADLRLAPAADSPNVPARALVSPAPIALEHERIVSIMPRSASAAAVVGPTAAIFTPENRSREPPTATTASKRISTAVRLVNSTH